MNKQEQSDYDAIMKKVQTMKWNTLGKWGPEMEVGTKLKWPGCRTLYFAVRDALHNVKIPEQALYYYVGGVAPAGKAGFRISGHSKPLKDGKVPDKCSTFGVLHIAYGPSAVV